MLFLRLPLGSQSPSLSSSFRLGRIGNKLALPPILHTCIDRCGPRVRRIVNPLAVDSVFIAKFARPFPEEFFVEVAFGADLLL